ncbi:MAG: hypothetical protein R3185_07790, partial [Candidatus Thermoplasmatota archaeon]|nr:hypothetical protein [Candidatus Thermoplasmatota archaeon]
AKPAVAQRRYLARGPPRGAPGGKAAAGRLLAGYVTRVAAQFDRSARPVFVHEHQHSLRAAFRIERGARKANEALEQVHGMVLCPACQTWGPEACACGQAEKSGPYWMGPLQDAGFLGPMLDAMAGASLAQPGKVARLLEHLVGEAEMGPFYLDVGQACKRLGASPPGREALIQALEDAGIPAARTAFSPEAVAYRGDPQEALEVLQGASPST